MIYRIDKQIFIENPIYGALGDDFSFKEIEAIEILINKIEDVLGEKSKTESIYGSMCYQIDVSKEKSLIYCYNELLGEEPTIEIYSMFKEYRDTLLKMGKNFI